MVDGCSCVAQCDLYDNSGQTLPLALAIIHNGYIVLLGANCVFDTFLMYVY